MWKQQGTSFVILLHMIFETVVYAEFKHSLWKRHRDLDGYEFTNKILSKQKAKSPVECVAKVSEQDECQSVTFNKGSKLCIGYNKQYANQSDGHASPGTEYRQQKSLCWDYKIINRTIATVEGFNRVKYTCDYGYVQSGSVLTSVCQQNQLWSDVDIECKECTMYKNTYIKRENKSFILQYTIDGQYIIHEDVTNPDGPDKNLQALKKMCNELSFYVCKAIISNKSMEYLNGILLPVRVYDHPSYQQHYKDNLDYDEFIRDCE